MVIDKVVKSAIQNCICCQAALPTFNTNSLSMSSLFSGPWTKLSIDFSGSYLYGKYLLLIIDEYSRHPLVKVIQSNKAFTVILVPERLFSMFGIPKILKSAPNPFNSHAFKQFATQLDFKHRKKTPPWPKSNAECKRFVKIFHKTIRIFQDQNTS